MSRRRAVLVRSVALISATVLLAGCSAIGGDAPKLDPEKSPLSEYWSALYGDYDQSDYDDMNKEQEELVAACMADEGFEYIPVDQSQYTSFSDDDVDRDTEEWVAEHGYGMQQSPEEIEEMNEQATEYVDPNQDYVMALSESEQTAYYEVLYGVQDMEPNADGEYEYNWETAGCQGAAQHEVQGEMPYDNDKYKDLLDDMNSVYEDVQKDPEMKKLDTEWAACMSEAGETGFKKKFDAMESISDELNAMYEDPTAQEDQDAFAETQEKLRKKEIKLALVDFHCSQEVDYSDRSLTIQFAAEQQFIDDNKKQLDEMVADAGK